MWQDYLDYIDAIVLDGLKKASLASLKCMLNQVVKSNMNEVRVCADDVTACRVFCCCYMLSIGYFYILMFLIMALSDVEIILTIYQLVLR